MTKKRALVCGVSGQDGAYLAHHLLSTGYEVWGTSRNPSPSNLTNLDALGVRSRINFISMFPESFRSVADALEQSDPIEVYYLASQSSVAHSFESPAATFDSAVIGVRNLLEFARLNRPNIRIYNACSSECFGDTKGIPAAENFPFFPLSPYAVAKAAAYWLVHNYRCAYGLYACNGILFNHESPLRPKRFVTQKIVHAVNRIAAGSDEVLTLGRLDIQRDWGWSPEYVEAMWLILQQERADDYVIATGQTNSLEEFVSTAFSIRDLDWRDHVSYSPEYRRPLDIECSMADPSKALRVFGWQANTLMRDVVRLMLEHARSTSNYFP